MKDLHVFDIFSTYKYNYYVTHIDYIYNRTIYIYHIYTYVQAYIQININTNSFYTICQRFPNCEARLPWKTQALIEEGTK